MRKIENNEIVVIGEIASDFMFDHETYGEKIYGVSMLSKRNSGKEDRIYVEIPERLIENESEWRLGDRVYASGRYSSFRVKGENRVKLYVFAREFTKTDQGEDLNSITLEGNICKNVVYRKTPLGREIADILLAVNRPYEKTDYIPCICWGRNAMWASGFCVGDRIRIEGRIQSREYRKQISEYEYESRIAYEVSVKEMEVTHD